MRCLIVFCVVVWIGWVGGSECYYYGCYTDSSVGSPLTTHIFNSYAFIQLEDMRLDTCSLLCANQGYALYGLLDGRSCYCSGSLPPLVESLFVSRSVYCIVPCSGDNSTYCGGTTYMDLYLNINKALLLGIDLRTLRIALDVGVGIGGGIVGNLGQAEIEPSSQSSPGDLLIPSWGFVLLVGGFLILTIIGIIVALRYRKKWLSTETV
eukprot:TRINITY_DN2151_c0_g2_i1.p1 TRINITY_DN2151_c0_g2~~TRINITY_DN2151_c0_g2_i1.p1  ORF type:complete len:208 (+),score=15.59 TRINITY_DN2151_c0_g2_i1:222-845(+)